MHSAGSDSETVGTGHRPRGGEEPSTQINQRYRHRLVIR